MAVPDGSQLYASASYVDDDRLIRTVNIYCVVHITVKMQNNPKNGGVFRGLFWSSPFIKLVLRKINYKLSHSHSKVTFSEQMIRYEMLF